MVTKQKTVDFIDGIVYNINICLCVIADLEAAFFERMFFMTKKPVRKKRKFRFFAVFVVVFLFVMVFKCAGQIVEINSLNAQRADLEGNYAELMDQQDKLEEQKALLNDETYLKRLARENLLMIREGEYLVVPYEENEDVVEYDENAPSDDEDIH